VGANIESSVSVSRDAEGRRRRRWSVQEKLRIVLETLEAEYPCRWLLDDIA